MHSASDRAYIPTRVAKQSPRPDPTSNSGVLSGKRILHCYVNAEFGGLASAFVSITNSLVQKGADVTVVLQQPAGELINEIDTGAKIIGLGYAGLPSYPGMALRLYDVVKRLRPEVLISHSWNCNVLAVIACRACNPRPKLILYEHTSLGFNNLYKGIRNLLKPFTIFPLYRQADALIVVSDGIRQEYEGRYHIPHDLVTVIPPPVDIGYVIRQAQEPVDHPWFNESIPIVAGVAPLTPAKDFSTLLNAFSLLRKDQPVRLVLIGDGPARGMLENMASQLGIEKDFQILGYQPNPYKYMVRSSVFASTSVVEGFGIAIVEALALGLPVVATTCDGPTDILEKGRYGILTPIGDSAATALAISRVLSDQALRASLSRSGRERAALYESEKILKRIENKIVSVLA
jgi:glycosyltransferase involved in cell wall biosynthesis